MNDKPLVKREIIREEYDKALQELSREEFNRLYSKEIKKVPYRPIPGEDVEEETFIEVEVYYHMV